ncbi:hypothetical protein I4U23_004652 [Adineta vaga]|nr:hypothetical protein I4U23_004652 [Adineta vaga]
MFVFIALTLFILNCHTQEIQVPPSRILFVGFPLYSHLKLLISIGRAVSPDHHVSFAVVDDHINIVRSKLESHRSVTFVSLGSLPRAVKKLNIRSDGSNLATIGHTLYSDILAPYTQMHEMLLNHLQTHSYDIIVVNVFCYAAQDLAHDLNIPMVIVTSLLVDDEINIPAWIPRGLDTLTQQQLRDSLFQRFYNYMVTPLLMIYYLKPHIYELNRLQHASNRSILKSRLGLKTQHWERHPVLIMSPLALEFRHSYAPNHHFVSFFLDEEERVDSDERINNLYMWLNETQPSDEFVVLVAFGTLTTLPESTWQVFIDALQFVPRMRLLLVIPQQNVRDKIKGSIMADPNRSLRVFITDWIPQQRVLKHPSVRTFITHGGMSSIGEAVYANVPLIILPGFADQPTNGAKIEEAMIGHILERRQLTATQIARKIEHIQAEYDRFVFNLRRIHRFCTVEGGGAKQASRLIDRWLLIGYDDEITIQHELPFLVATNLDVQLTLTVLIITIVYLFWRLSSFIICSCLRLKKYKRE